MDPWLCITNEENWKVIRSKRIWAVAEKDVMKIQRVNVGDFLVFYVKQKIENHEKTEPQIKGIFEATSEPFLSEKIDFPAIERFPWRIRIKPLVVPKKPLQFKKLIPNLQFIRNKKKWFLHLQFAMRTIPERDFDLIQSEILGG